MDTNARIVSLYFTDRPHDVLGSKNANVAILGDAKRATFSEKL
jgi:hypothetical protein